jgi:hypothetical protein
MVMRSAYALGLINLPDNLTQVLNHTLSVIDRNVWSDQCPHLLHVMRLSNSYNGHYAVWGKIYHGALF